MEKQRYEWLDSIRATACIMVVLLHVCALYLYAYNTIPLSSWMTGNLIDSATRVCVPLFFMISGFLFFSDKVPRYIHFKKIILGLLFYSAIALVYAPFALKITNPQTAIQWHASTLFNVIKAPAFYHLWYFYALIPVYLFACLVRTRDIGNRNLMIFFVILFIVLNSRTSQLLAYFDIKFNSRFQINSDHVYYFLYAVMGSFIGKSQWMNTIKLKITLGITFLLSSLFIALATYGRTKLDGQFNGTFYAYTSPLVAIAACSLFALLKINGAPKGALTTQTTKIIAKHSLAIYGIHAFILDLINRLDLRLTNQPMVDIPLIFTVVLTLSLLFSILLKKVDTKGYFS